MSFGSFVPTCKEHLAYNAVETYSWDAAKKQISVHYRQGNAQWLRSSPGLNPKLRGGGYPLH